MKKIEIKKLKSNVLQSIYYTLKTIIDAGYEAYLVGGCVRDLVLGLDPKDYDITTNALPDEIEQLFAHTIPTGKKHGTITALYYDEIGDNYDAFEITTYRTETIYSDNRHPDDIKFVNSLEEDLSRRDFTMNALACDIDGNIIDLFDGVDDINKKLLQCVGNPDERFKEDALRMLRALRFAARLGFHIQPDVSKAIYDNIELINNLSIERIRDEFNKIITCDNISSACKLINDYISIFEIFIPEIADQLIMQNNKYHTHQWLLSHTLAVMKTTRNNLILRLAAFFHDFGKKKCYSEEIKDEQICGHFYGHPDVSAQMVEDIMTRMRYSNDEIMQVKWLVENHDVLISSTIKSVKKMLNKAPSIELFDLLLELKHADRIDHVAILGKKFPQDIPKIIELKDYILESNTAFTLRQLAVNGYDIMNLGYTGKQVGQILNYLLAMVIDEQLINEKEALIKFIKEDLAIQMLIV